MWSGTHCTLIQHRGYSGRGQQHLHQPGDQVHSVHGVLYTVQKIGSISYRYFFELYLHAGCLRLPSVQCTVLWSNKLREKKPFKFSMYLKKCREQSIIKNYIFSTILYYSTLWKDVTYAYFSYQTLFTCISFIMLNALLSE